MLGEFRDDIDDAEEGPESIENRVHRVSGDLFSSRINLKQPAIVIFGYE